VRLLLVVRAGGGILPAQRAALYMKATNAMLRPDYGPDVAVADRLGQLVGANLTVHRDLVQHVAFHMHRRGPEQGQAIGEGALRRLLQESPYEPHIDDFLSLTRMRGTLLAARFDRYRFIHLVFQEFMAARYLAEAKRDEEGLDSIVFFFETGPVLDSWWREVVLLTAGYLGVTSPYTARRFLRRLAGVDGAARDRTLSPNVQLAAAELAAIALSEAQLEDEPLRQSIVARLAALFTDSDTMATAPPALRALAGDALARLGDPRPGVGVRPMAGGQIRLPDIELCYAPPGPFWMGSDEDDPGAEEYETNQHKVDLTYGYWIGRYPVTVAQFQAFVADTGHRPADSSALQEPPNRPVRFVTWDNALAFCRWLTERAHEHTLVPLEWSFALPSEAEWEKAARGGLDLPQTPTLARLGETLTISEADELDYYANPHPRARYPWGNVSDPNRANYNDAGLQSTTAAGTFPQGISPYGLMGCSGNVGEWTRSLQRPYPYHAGDGRENLTYRASRAVRGGAFWHSLNEVRCASRHSALPHYIRGYGFRVALVPSARLTTPEAADQT
jgi:formylglycine-generating enzyme required for sulfatase activity